MEYRCYATHALWIIRFIHSRAFLSVLLRSILGIFAMNHPQQRLDLYRSTPSIRVFLCCFNSKHTRCIAPSTKYLLNVWHALFLFVFKWRSVLSRYYWLMGVNVFTVSRNRWSYFCDWKYANFVCGWWMINRFHLGKQLTHERLRIIYEWQMQENIEIWIGFIELRMCAEWLICNYIPCNFLH